MVGLVLLIVYAIPILSIILLFIKIRWNLLIVSASTALSSLYLAVLSLHTLISGNSVLLVENGDPSSPTYINMVIDPLSSIFLLAHGIVWFIASFYSVYYIAGTRLNPIAYWIYYNMLYVVTMSYFLTTNPVIMILLLDLALVLSALLIAIDRANVRARRTAILYLITLSITSAVSLLGFLILIAYSGGYFNYLSMREWFKSIHVVGGPVVTASILILIGFSAKMELVPLQLWTPRAHAEAPSPISAILSSVGVSLGVYGIARIFFYVLEPFEIVNLVLLIMGVMSIIYGSIYALACRDIKRLVAYSTIAHMGYIAFGFASAGHLLGAEGIYGLLGSITFVSLLLYVFSHTLVKALLFLSIGNIEAGIGLRDLNKLGGLSKAMKNTYRIIIIAALQLIGIPPSMTFIAKSLAHTATLSSMTQVFFESSIAVIATLLTASYMLKLLFKLSSPSKEYHRLLDLIERKHSRLYDKYAVLLLYGFTGLIIALSLSVNLLYSIIGNLSLTIGGVDIVDYVFISPIIAYTRIPALIPLISPEQELVVVVSTMLIIPLLTLAAYYIWSHLEYFSVYFRRIHDELVHERMWLKIKYMVKSLQYRLEDLEYNSRIMFMLSFTIMIILVLLILAGG